MKFLAKIVSSVNGVGVKSTTFQAVSRADRTALILTHLSVGAVGCPTIAVVSIL